MKIADLYQQLSRKQVPAMHKGKYPLLSSLKQYNSIIHLEEEIDNKLQEYRQAYKKAVDEVLTHIQEWRWNDPVTLLNSEIFDQNAFIEPLITNEDLKKDLEHRLAHNIPPGYKDRGKEDSGIGDLLIWHTILEIGKTKKKDVIFVSGDEKPDWYLRSEGRSLYPRYELVDEFRRHSDGQTFHIVKLSNFLELFGANEKVVEEVRQEETVLKTTQRMNMSSEAEATDAIIRWLRDTFGDETAIEPNLRPGAPDLFFIDRTTSNVVGVEVKFSSSDMFMGQIFMRSAVYLFPLYRRMLVTDAIFLKK